MAVVIGMPYACDGDRQDEDETGEANDRPSLGEAVVRKERLESDKGG